MLPFIPELADEKEREAEEDVEGRGSVGNGGGVSGTVSADTNCLI